MLKSDLKPLVQKVVASKPLAPRRQKVAPISPWSVAEGAGLAIATGVASNCFSAWLYDKYIRPKRKSKKGSKSKDGKRTSEFRAVPVFIVEQAEEWVETKTKVKRRWLVTRSHEHQK